MRLMAERDLSGPGQTRAIRDILQSLFICELVRPSKPLWLFFAWTTDIEILDNSARQFAALCPDWPSAPIRLSTVLDGILSRAGSVNVLLRQSEHNMHFIARLEHLRQRYGSSAIKWCVRPEFHKKGMLGDDYVLTGSMNLTVRGLAVNDENVTLRCDPKIVAEQRIDLQTRWGHQLQ
jgi:phosphatidylserine/phosphatidylglycerophosphate/cardiolipin synthase-like enzyme